MTKSELLERLASMPDDTKTSIAPIDDPTWTYQFNDVILEPEKKEAILIYG